MDTFDDAASLRHLVKKLCTGVRLAQSAKDWNIVADIAFDFERLAQLVDSGAAVVSSSDEDEAPLILDDAEAADCATFAAMLRDLSTVLADGGRIADNLGEQLEEAASMLDHVYLAHHPVPVTRADPRCTCDPAWRGHGTACPLHEDYIRSLSGTGKPARP